MAFGNIPGLYVFTQAEYIEHSGQIDVALDLSQRTLKFLIYWVWL